MKSFIFRKKTGFLSLLISLLSVFIYRNILSDVGIGYMVCSYLVVTFIWMILGSGFSDSMSRMVRSRLSKGQLSNAMNILSVSFVNQFLCGLLGGFLCGFLNYMIMNDVLHFPKGRFLGYYLCVYFFFRMISEYFAGYAIVTGNEKAVSLADALRELFRIVSGFIFMKMMYDKGLIVSALLMDEDIKYVYAVSGLFIGFCISELLVCTFLFVIKFGMKLKSNGDFESLSSKDHALNIFINLWYRRLGNIVHGAVFCFVLLFVAARAVSAASVGTAFNIIFEPFAISALIALVFGASSSVNWVSCVRKKEKGNARIYFDFGIHIVVISSVFTAAFFASVSKLLIKLLVEDGAVMKNTDLILAVIASICYSVALFSDQLCAMRDDRIPRIVADILSAAMTVLICKLGTGPADSLFRILMIALMVYSVVNMIVWFVITYFRMNMVFDPLRNIMIPVVAGAVSAIGLLLITNVAAAHLGNLFTALLCIPIGLLIFHAVLLLLRNYTESELKLMPLGGVIYGLGQILRVM